MENTGLIHTDLGLISRDNANYLYKQNLIDREGRILHNLRSGLAEKAVELYSYFRWIVDDIKDKIPSTPKMVKLSSEDFINLMRVGNISLSYKAEDGQEYKYIARYPVVESLERNGKQTFVNHNDSKTIKNKAVIEDF